MRTNASLSIAVLSLAALNWAQASDASPPTADRSSEVPALHTFTDGQGPVIVMLGGGTGGAAAFAVHARMLASDFRVLRPQPLRLGMAPNGSLPHDYSIRMESAALARTLDEQNARDPVVLVGHSFGALVALDFALDRPERVRALVLAEPPAFWVVPPDELRADPAMLAMVELSRNFGPAIEPTDDQLSQFLTILGRPGATPPAEGQPARKQWESSRAALRGLAAVPNHKDDPERLRTLRTPVLLVTGTDTVAFHRRINEILAAALPAPETVELPGGHGASSGAPEEFVAILRRFIASHP